MLAGTAGEVCRAAPLPVGAASACTAAIATLADGAAGVARWRALTALEVAAAAGRVRAAVVGAGTPVRVTGLLLPTGAARCRALTPLEVARAPRRVARAVELAGAPVPVARLLLSAGLVGGQALARHEVARALRVLLQPVERARTAARIAGLSGAARVAGWRAAAAREGPLTHGNVVAVPVTVAAVQVATLWVAAGAAAALRRVALAALPAGGAPRHGGRVERALAVVQVAGLPGSALRALRLALTWGEVAGAEWPGSVRAEGASAAILNRKLVRLSLASGERALGKHDGIVGGLPI